jgi:hypothetical protein
MTRLRQQMNALDNIIRSDRFDADRERRAKMQREYVEGIAETGDFKMLADMHQSEETRGDGVQKARGCWLDGLATALIGGMLFGLLVYAWVAGIVEVGL